MRMKVASERIKNAVKKKISMYYKGGTCIHGKASVVTIKIAVKTGGNGNLEDFLVL